MRYKRLRKDTDYRLNIPSLSGGVHPCTPPTLIEDDELSEACNVMWKQGALVTRPSLHADEEHWMGGLAGDPDHELNTMFESICTRPFEVDGQLCTVVISAANYVGDVSHQEIAVVTLDGKILTTYTLGAYAVLNMVAVPCDEDVLGCPFLVYRHNQVYRPNSETHTLEQILEEEMYAPLVMLNGKPLLASGNTDHPDRRVTGVMYEGFNRLSTRYRARFTVGNTAGHAEFLYMPTLLRENRPVRVEGYTPHGNFDVTVDPREGGAFALQNGGDTKNYTISVIEEQGLITISPPLPVSTISDNVTVTAYAADNPQGLGGPTIATWFGGTNNRLGGTRLFLAGCEKEAARILWSDVANPLYFPENNYMLVGDPTRRVTALDKQDDMLVIFKENELYYTTYEQGRADEDAVIAGTAVDVTVWQAYFPVRQLSPYIGCDCPDTIAVCHDRLVWMDSSGRVYTLASTAMYSERTVREIGGKILPYLQENTTLAQRKAASAADYNSGYWLFIGNRAYVFDYTDTAFLYVTGYTSSDKTASDRLAWYMHRFDRLAHNARQCIVSDGRDRAVLFSTHYTLNPKRTYVRMIYTFTDGDKDLIGMVTVRESGEDSVVIRDYPIEAAFTTKAFTFGDPAAYKRIKALFLEAQAANATVQCIADGHDAPKKAFSSTAFGVHLVLPCIKRCRTMAVRITSTTPLCVRGLRVQYTPFGCVR